MIFLGIKADGIKYLRKNTYSISGYKQKIRPAKSLIAVTLIQ